MSSSPAPLDPAEFLQTAARYEMVPEDAVRELTKQVRRANQPVEKFLVNAGRLSPIQAEAIAAVLRPDSVADGYKIEGLLGHGGIGIVYRARQPNLDREVALKTISTARVREAQGGKSSSSIARFQQEAVVIAKLKHPNIVTAYDYGATDDRLYLAMEMVEGIDLETHIRRNDRLDEATAWRMAAQVAAALAHAADAGVIHRDIKPANLLLTDPPAGYPLAANTPLVKVTDFGLARFQAGQAGDDKTRLTMTGATMGTPHYMAPEQIDDAKVGLHADIYALGATVYHMIAGEPPLAGLSLMKIFAAKLSGEGASIEDLPEDVSKPTRQLLADMLQHDPQDRPQDYGELLGRIADVLADESLQQSASAISLGSEPLITLRQAGDRSMLSQTLEVIPGSYAWLRKILPAIAVAGGLIAVGLLYGLYARTPPTPGYRPIETISEQLDPTKVVPLYEGDGQTAGWSGSMGTLTPGYLDVFGELSRTIAGQTDRFPDPQRFALQLKVQLAEKAEALEIYFDETSDRRVATLRIEQQQAVLGVIGDAGRGDLAPAQTTEIQLPAFDQGGYTFRLDRDERHWFCYQLLAGESLPLGSVAVGTDPPEEIRFKSIGGKSSLGEIRLRALEPIRNDNAP